MESAHLSDRDAVLSSFSTRFIPLSFSFPPSLSIFHHHQHYLRLRLSLHLFLFLSRSISIPRANSYTLLTYLKLTNRLSNLSSAIYYLLYTMAPNYHRHAFQRRALLGGCTFSFFFRCDKLVLFLTMIFVWCCLV